MKKKIIIIAIVLVCAGVGLFSIAFVASGRDLSNLSVVRYEKKTYTVSEEFENISLDTDDSDITFKKSKDGKLSVDCMESDNFKHKVYIENNTLIVEAQDERAWYEHISFFSDSPSVTVYLPADSYRMLKINSTTGDISIENDLSFSDINIEASTGDVGFKGQTDGELRIKTTTGDIILNDVKAQSIDLSVSTGDVEAKDIDCADKLAVEVTTGELELEGVTCKSFVTTGSTGDIEMDRVVASDSFDVERSTGDIDFEKCDADTVRIEASTGDVNGSFTSDKIVIAKTSVGEVNVPKIFEGGRCEITTSTGDINISIKK